LTSVGMDWQNVHITCNVITMHQIYSSRWAAWFNEYNYYYY